MTKLTKAQIIEERIKHYIEDGAKAEAAFAAKIKTEGLTYALQWADDAAVKAALADLWQGVQRDPDYTTAPLSDVIEKAVRKVQKQLLNNWIRERSTSEFSNATSGARAEAHARFNEQATEMVEWLRSE